MAIKQSWSDDTLRVKSDLTTDERKSFFENSTQNINILYINLTFMTHNIKSREGNIEY